MNSDIEMLQTVPDGKPVRVFLPLINSDERIRAQCVYQSDSSPIFKLIFKPGILPTELIDPHQACIISIDMGGPAITLEAMIRNIVNSQTLEMIVNKSISHEQMREYFRVDAIAEITVASYHNNLVPKESEHWAISAKTVDISGSGILAILPGPPPADKQVILRIAIPTAPGTIVEVLSHPVRTKEMSDGRYEVAYHFDDITPENRDAIIGCCLVLQRKLLRLKVQVKENWEA